MSCIGRTYPLTKPKNHRLPIPRWRLNLASGVSHVYTTYIGLQQRSEDQATIQAKIEAMDVIEDWLKTDDGPSASESFTFVDGNDAQKTAVWVCYWVDAAKHQRSYETLCLPSLYSRLAVPGRASIGMWLERFATAISRLETNYSGLDYLPGIARLPETSTEEHTLSAYWGAARDRIPDSAHDLFPLATDTESPKSTPKGIGQHLVGTNYENIVHIRSGQFWENCSLGEAESYESKLEPTLRTGLKYLCENPVEAGVVGIRYLRNEDFSAPSCERKRKETCGAGFFTSLENMEKWAKNHRSHLAIYRGALAHYKAFGDNRKLRTWHEVSVLKGGEARFEYINCPPETGVIGRISLDVRQTY
ncbi:hypothetical protein K505DRAFT_12258 [Melanomma pulvis-pyrius CBS 109.77]|uniref:Phenylacetaldoxime dehydratase n=1 Tax=Melanomma pulvis-pyrius CBS 109.77 TaxID=1314802 RepID=A0A6A6XWE4_9PLEO|nr:hypothetical protein K505DRAFT_12258 [Melanomma pulvis-pyrius CBS 109.77]